MNSETAKSDPHNVVQGSAPPVSQAEYLHQLELYKAKLHQRTTDLVVLKRTWSRLPWLWTSLVTIVPLAFFFSIWGIFIGLGLALSLVGVGYYITYAHVSQHEMEIVDIRRRLDLLQATSGQWEEKGEVGVETSEPSPPRAPILL